MDKIFNNANYETKENEKINYSTPKIYEEGVLKSDVKYLEDGEIFNLCFETDVFILHKGIQKNSNNIYYIDLEFNEGNEALHDFIGELDELGIGKTWKNSKEWFGTLMDLDLIDSFYKFPLRTNKKGNMPYIRLKLDMNNLVVKNQYGAKLNLDSISGESKVKVKIRYNGLLFYKQLFTPLYYVYEIKYYQQRKKVEDGFSFYTYDNDLPEMTAELVEKGFETEAEELYDFDRKNEEDIMKIQKLNTQTKNNTEKDEEDEEEEDEEYEEDEDEEEEDEENTVDTRGNENNDVNVNVEDNVEDNADEINEYYTVHDNAEENVAEPNEECNKVEEQEDENLVEILGDGSLGEVEDVEVKNEEEVEERKEEEINEILSKNLTKVLEKGEETLAIYEDDPLEEQENKLREMLRRVEKAKATYTGTTGTTGTNVSETSIGSRKGKKKRILRYSKSRVVNQQL